MSKGDVQGVIVPFREIYFKYRSRLGECHPGPALRPSPVVSLSLAWAFQWSYGRRFWAGGHRTAAVVRKNSIWTVHLRDQQRFQLGNEAAA